METTEPIKVIFLDIDGVLQTHRINRAFDELGVCTALDPVGVSFLNLLCRKDRSLKIVISSDWRRGRDYSTFQAILGSTGASYLKEALYLGMGEGGVESCLDFKTKDLITSRGHEIEEWLSRHPQVEKYVIIDDQGGFLEYQEPFVVKTSYDDGISNRNMIEVETLLYGKEILDGSSFTQDG